MASYLKVVPLNESGAPITDVTWVLWQPDMSSAISTGSGTCTYQVNGNASYPFIIRFYGGNDSSGRPLYKDVWTTVYSNTNDQVKTYVTIPGQKTHNVKIYFSKEVQSPRILDVKTQNVLWSSTSKVTMIKTPFISSNDEFILEWTDSFGAHSYVFYDDGKSIDIDNEEAHIDVPGDYKAIVRSNTPVFDVIVKNDSDRIVRKTTVTNGELMFNTWDRLDNDFTFYISEAGYGSASDTVTAVIDIEEAYDNALYLPLTQKQINYVNVTAKDAVTGSTITDFDWNLHYGGQSFSGTSSELKYSYMDEVPTYTIDKAGYEQAGGNSSGVISMTPLVASKTLTVTVRDYDSGAAITDGSYSFWSGSTLLKGDINTTGTFFYTFTDNPADGVITYKWIDPDGKEYSNTVTVTENKTVQLSIGAEKYVDCRFYGGANPLSVNYKVKDGSTVVKQGTGTSVYYQYEGVIKNFTIEASATGYESANKLVQSNRVDLTDIYETLSLTAKVIPTITVTGSTSATKGGGRYSGSVQFNNFTTIEPTFSSPSWITGTRYSNGSIVFDVASNTGSPREGYITITNYEDDIPYSAQYLVKQNGVIATCKITLNIKDGSTPFTGGVYSFQDINGNTLSSGINTSGTVSYSFTKDSIPDNKVLYDFVFNEFQSRDTVVVGTDTVINIQIQSSGYINVKYTDSEGNPIVGEYVTIKEYGKGVIDSVVTNNEGIVYYDGLQVGSQYELIIAPEGYQSNTKIVTARDTTGHISLDTVVLSTAVDPIVTVSPKNMNALANGDQLVATVEMKNFSIDVEPTIGKPSWITVYYFSPSELRMFVEQNNGVARDGTVTVYRYEGTTQYSDSLVIHQAGKNEDYLTVGGTLNVLATDTTSQTCWVSSTDKETLFSYSTPSSSWLHIDSATLSNGIYTIRYHCDENTTPYRRTATFTVTQGNLSTVVSVAQSAGQATSTITLPSDRTTLSSKRQTVTFIAKATGNAIGKPFTFTSSAWITDVRQQWNGDTCTITATVLANSGSVRSGSINMSYDSASATYYITQLTTSTTDTKPIWEETTITQPPSNSFLEYHIDDSSSNILYAAKAYKLPEESSVTWSINEPISNYLGNSITFSEGVHKMNDYILPFTVVTNTGFSKIYYFYNSWAYQQTPIGGLLSDPIDGRVDPRQFFVCSWLSLDGGKLVCSGQQFSPTESISGNTMVRDLSQFIYACGSSFEAYTNRDTTKRNKYVIDSGDYVLYYTNSFGGWDSLLLLDSCKKIDEIESFTYGRKDRRVKYLNRVNPTWQLRTNYWIDGEKMYHLLESTEVYLHNLKTNEIIPVIIRDTQCEYRNQNNERKPYYYEIEVEEANYKYRK